jgi:hypothetical protein
MEEIALIDGNRTAYDVWLKPYDGTRRRPLPPIPP